MINRTKELERLYEWIMSRESLLLHAPAGMGKTHLINQLSKRLEGRRICFHINLRGLQNSRQFLHFLLEAIHQSAGGRSNLHYQLKRLLDERPLPLELNSESLTHWLESLLVGLQNVSLDFLFIFEDLDQWEGRENLSEILLPFFRARNSQALLTATIPFRGFDDALLYELPPLAPENIDLPDEELSGRLLQVLELSQGNTGFFLELVHKNALSQRPLHRALEAVLEDHHPVFYNFRQRFTDLQWRLLRAIASEGCVAQPHAFDFLINYRLGAASSVERAIRNLSDSGIIHRTGAGWRISQVLFQRWLEWLYPQQVKVPQAQ